MDLCIGEILSLQRRLQALNRERWGGLSPDKGRSSLLWAIVELSEAAEVIKKEGDEAITLNPDIRGHFTEEVADALMYLGDLLLCYGIDEATFSRVYREKCRLNRQRWTVDHLEVEGAIPAARAVRMRNPAAVPGCSLLPIPPGWAAWGVLDGDKPIAVLTTRLEGDTLAASLWAADSKAAGDAIESLILTALEQQRLEHRPALLAPMGMADTLFEKHGFVPTKDRWAHVLPKQPAFTDADVILRLERPHEEYDVDAMIRRSFFNRYRPGCDEHLLTRRIRTDRNYLPAYSRVAEVDGQAVGGIWYVRSLLNRPHGSTPVMMFGPLAVDPRYQHRGIGRMLIEHTAHLARQAGERGIIILGNPAYYSRFGFRHALTYGITLPDGSCPDAMQALELTPGGLSGEAAQFQLAPVYEDLSPEDNAMFDRRFPPLTPQSYPCQFAG